MRIWGFFILILNIYSINAQNLIVNPGAELDPLTNGWSEGVVAMPTNTFHWTRSNNFLGEAPPHGGSYHFYANDNSNGNYYLYQDVDVSAYASYIDAGTCPFTFSFWTRMYNYSSFPTPNDAARVIVEYRDAGGTVLSTYDSGWRTQLAWTQYTDTRTAPANTRTIHIRLQSGFTSGSGADGYFDDLSLTTPVMLPVSLVNFEAKALIGFILINWQTSCEKDNAHFTLQKSADGEHWSIISKQAGTLESNSLRSYSFADLNPFEGHNYYQLVQTDVDGSKTFSEIIYCLFNQTAEVLIYPNPCPAGERLHISTKEKCSIQVYSSKGEVIFSDEKDLFDSRSLAPGVYYFVVQSILENSSRQVIIE